MIAQKICSNFTVDQEGNGWMCTQVKLLGHPVHSTRDFLLTNQITDHHSIRIWKRQVTEQQETIKTQIKTWCNTLHLYNLHSNIVVQCYQFLAVTQRKTLSSRNVTVFMEKRMIKCRITLDITGNSGISSDLMF